MRGCCTHFKETGTEGKVRKFEEEFYQVFKYIHRLGTQKFTQPGNYVDNFHKFVLRCEHILVFDSR